MSSPGRVLAIGGALCAALGLLAWIGSPGDAVDPREEAPLLAAFYAAPVEVVDTHVLRSGETLGGVLARAEIGGVDAANLLLALRERFNPRRLVAGAEVTIRRWAASGETRAVELRVNADSTIRLARGEWGWESDVIVVPTVVDTVFAAGVIESGRSLYLTLIGDDALRVPTSERVQVVDDLEQIFGYRLDFTRDIQPGDSYRFVYEREARPDGSARTRRVLVAEIVAGGKSYPALHFAHGDGSEGYYDTEGNSVRTAFLRNPVRSTRITSSFSWRRYHPVLGIHRAHVGVDYGAPTGTPVFATGDGVVAFAGRNGGYGNVVDIRHPGGYLTRYAHLSRFASGIRPGRRVQIGETIGYVGATGLATGPHLHYEFRKNGQPLNPRAVKLPGGPPIPSELRPRFEAQIEQRLALLDGLGVGPRLAAGNADGAGVGGGI